MYPLILKLNNREKGIFWRIGFARGWVADMQQKIMAPCAEESKFPCDAYRDGLHPIYIIYQSPILSREEGSRSFIRVY